MKIAMICDDIKVGGIATRENAMASAMRRLGHHVELFESWHVDAKKLKEFDIVHLHTLWRLGRLRDLPLVFTAHGKIFLISDETMPYRSRFRLYNVWAYLSGKLYKKHIRASIAISKQAAAVLKRQLGLNADAIIRPGIDTRRFSRDVPPLQLKGFPRLVYAGPVVHRKNIKELLYIVKALKRIYPTAMLYALGWVTSQDYMREVLLLQESLGLQDSVRFEFVPPENVPRYFRSCDIYVAASTVDWTPLSTFEAMSCGTPVLLSDIEAHKEIVEETRGGETYSLGDPNSAVLKIQEILANLDRYREQSRDFLLKASWEDRAKQVLDVYRQVLNH